MVHLSDSEDSSSPEGEPSRTAEEPSSQISPASDRPQAPQPSASSGDPRTPQPTPSPGGSATPNSQVIRRVLESKTELLDPFRCVNGSRVRAVGKFGVKNLRQSLRDYGWISLSAPLIHYPAERVDLLLHFQEKEKLSDAEALRRTNEALVEGSWSAILEGNHRIRAIQELADSDDPEERSLWSKFLVPSVLTTDTSRAYVQSFAIALNQIQKTSEPQSYSDELNVYKGFLDSSAPGTASAAAARAFLAASAKFTSQTTTGKKKKLTTISQDMAKAREISYRALRTATELAASKENRKSLLNHNNVKFPWRDLSDEDQVHLVNRMDFAASKKMPNKAEAMALKMGLLAMKKEIQKVLSFCNYASIGDAPVHIATTLRRSLEDNRLDEHAIRNEPASEPCEALLALVREHDLSRYTHAMNSARERRNLAAAEPQAADASEPVGGEQAERTQGTTLPGRPSLDVLNHPQFVPAVEYQASRACRADRQRGRRAGWTPMMKLKALAHRPQTPIPRWESR